MEMRQAPGGPPSNGPHDGWQGDLQPGERMGFHSDAPTGGAGNDKTVYISNYPVLVANDQSYCEVYAFNPSHVPCIGFPDSGMYTVWC